MRILKCYFLIALAYMAFALEKTQDLMADPLRVANFRVIDDAWNDDEDASTASAISYFRRVIERMGIDDVSYSEMPLKRLLFEVQAGHQDMGLPIVRTPERAALVKYSAKPLFQTKSVLVVRNDSDLKAINSVEDLIGLKIGYIVGAYLSPMMRDERLKIEYVAGVSAMESNYKKLLYGRIDGIYFPDMFGTKYEELRRGVRNVRSVPLPEPWVKFYVVFSKEGAEKYLPRYETALEQLQQEQTYAEYYNAVMKDLFPNVEFSSQ